MGAGRPAGSRAPGGASAPLSDRPNPTRTRNSSQIKSKALYRSIQNHLCPAITGRAGGGKSTFAIEFCSPLQELMSPPVVISDFVDPRSGELFGYPVIFLDDLAHLSPKHFEILNSVITGARLVRRKLGTNKVVLIAQRSTPI